MSLKMKEKKNESVFVKPNAKNTASAMITGFDIGEKSMKIAQCTRGEAKKLINVELPDNLVSGGQILSAEAMSETLATVAKENDLLKKDVALLLPSSQVMVRTITAPIMTERQLEFNLPFEFRDYLTEEKTKYIFDYEVLETVTDELGMPVEQRLFVCACQRAVIERYRNIFSHAGFNLKVAVPEEYVFAKLARGQMGNVDLANQTFALVDLGHQATTVHILSNGEYDTKRIIDMGISDLERIFAEEIDCDIHMAHNYKMANYKNMQNHTRALELYNRMGVEILKAVNFYNYNNRDVELKDLYLMGGGAAIAPLTRTVSDVTGLKVHSVTELVPSAEKAAEDPWLYLRAICCAAGE